jgi:diaminopimelate epimerase
MHRLISFTKMHGLGNDYIYVDLRREPLNGLDRPTLARAMSDRHRGVGADGLILIGPPEPGAAADCRMEMYNADGSRSEMCGNGIRCVAKYVIEHPPGTVDRTEKLSDRVLRIQTDRGVLETVSHVEGGQVRTVRVDMGPPILEPGKIPVRVAGNRCVRHPLTITGRPFAMTCISMGNPHAVIFDADQAVIDLARFGPLIERHELFPNRTNVHVASVVSRGEVAMRTWERGTGLTQACGTGACAAVVAGVIEERLDRRVLVHLPGGDLTIEWPEGGSVFKTGPAEYAFRGEWPVDG